MNSPGHMKDEGAGACDAGPLKQDLHLRNIACAARGVKRLAKLQIHLALAGFTLTRAAGGYYVGAPVNQPRRRATPEPVEQRQRGAAA